MRKQVPFCLVLIAAGWGCVTVDSTLTLEYEPAVQPLAEAPTPVFLSRVADRRPDTSRIGCKKSGFGSESATLTLDVPLHDWFGGVMNTEFKQAGLGLAGADQADAVRVEVDLLEFFIEPQKSFFGSYEITAVVYAEVVVRFPDGTGYARKFASYGRDDSLMPTDGSYEDVMLTAMKGWIQQAVTDIVRLIDHRRRSGSADATGVAGWKAWS